jgi:hypothetical protein
MLLQHTLCRVKRKGDLEMDHGGELDLNVPQECRNCYKSRESHDKTNDNKEISTQEYWWKRRESNPVKP